MTKWAPRRTHGEPTDLLANNKSDNQVVGKSERVLRYIIRSGCVEGTLISFQSIHERITPNTRFLYFTTLSQITQHIYIKQDAFKPRISSISCRGL